MDDSALERYFDDFIANDSLKMETEEVKVNKESDKEKFLSLLPDELLTLYKDAGTKNLNENESRTGLDYSSQNPTAEAWLPGGSSVTQQPELIPQIQNVTSSVYLGCCLDLQFIAHKAWNIEYKEKSFKGLTMRIRRPRATGVIYKSGKIVCTGAKSEEQSRIAARKFARIIQKLGYPARFLNFKVWNLVVSCNTSPINLEQLAKYHHCSYEPELFPGLLYSGIPGVSVAIFPSGKMSLTGIKKEADINTMLDTIAPILSHCRR